MRDEIDKPLAMDNAIANLIAAIRDQIRTIKDASSVDSMKRLKELRAENASLKSELASVLDKMQQPAFSILNEPSSTDTVKSTAKNNRGKTDKVSTDGIDAKAKSGGVVENQQPKIASKGKGVGEQKSEEIHPGRLDFRIGKIVSCERHPDADSLYVEKIDLGESAPRTIVSGLVKYVPIEEMRDRMVVVLCNLKPAKMRGVTSEGMVMCASTPDKVEILSPPETASTGDLITFAGYSRNPDSVLNPKKKVWESLMPDFRTGSDLIAKFKDVPFEVVGKGVVKAPSLLNVQIK